MLVLVALKPCFDLAWERWGTTGTTRVVLSVGYNRAAGRVGILVASMESQTNQGEPTLGCRIRGWWGTLVIRVCVCVCVYVCLRAAAYNISASTQ